jgi:hypothetical protein
MDNCKQEFVAMFPVLRPFLQTQQLIGANVIFIITLGCSLKYWRLCVTHVVRIDPSPYLRETPKSSLL